MSRSVRHRVAGVSRYGWVLVVSLAVTAIAVPYVAGLRVATRLEDLLPHDAPAAEDYRRYERSFEGAKKMWVVVSVPDAEDTESVAEAADVLAAALEADPAVAWARAGATEREERFWQESVLPRALLLMPREALPLAARRLEPEAIRERLRGLRADLVHPASILTASLAAADPLGLAELFDVSGPSADPATGAFLSEDGRSALVLASPAGAELDPEAGRRIVRAVVRGGEEAGSAVGLPVEVHAVGGPLYAAHDERVLRGDLVRTVTGSVAGVVVLLLLYFRGPVVPVLLAASVFAGVVWTGAAVRLVRGEIGVVGASFAAILVGLGVDYGIHGATAFRESLAHGRSPEAAMGRALRSTGPAILASVGTTAGAFVVLLLARLDPVRELGAVVAVGMVAVLVAALTVGAPALVLTAAGARERRGEGVLWTGLQRCTVAVVGFGVRRPVAIAIGAAVLTAAAVAGLPRLEFEADLRSLRPSDHPVIAAERVLHERFGTGLESFTVMVAGDDVGSALAQAAAVKRAVLHVGGPEVVVVSPSDWLVEGALLDERARRVERTLPVAQAATAVRQAIEAEGFAPDAFAPFVRILDTLAADGVPEPVSRDEWPVWLHDLVRHGTDGRARVAVEVRIPPGSWIGGPPDDVVAAVREAAPGAAIASVARVGSELRGLLASDAGRLAVAGLVAVAGVVLVSFRGRAVPAALSLVPVALASTWTLGLCAWGGVALDPLSIAVSPILVGIGIDDGLHAVHGTRYHGDVRRSVLAAGRAMGLTTLTTCVGFGGLVLSHVPSLRRGGAIVAVGTMLCLIVTLVLLPALGGSYPAQRRRRREGAVVSGAPQSPEAGPMARLLGAFGITGVFWYRFHCWGVRVAPEWLVRLAIVAFTTAFFVLLTRIRRALGSNLDPVLGPCGYLERQRRAYRTMRTFAWCLTERYERLATGARFRIDAENLPAWRKVAADGRGFIVVTGHVGNWEIGSALPDAMDRRSIHVVREEEMDPRAQAFVRELLDERMGPGYVTHFAGADPALGVTLRETLDRGEIVALQADRPRRGGRTIAAELFGRPYGLPAGPIALARVAGVPLVPVFVLRRSRRRYLVAVGEPIRVGVGPRDAATRECAARLAQALERVIGREPHQWFCFRDLWPAVGAHRGQRSGEDGLAIEPDVDGEHAERPGGVRAAGGHDERCAGR